MTGTTPDPAKWWQQEIPDDLKIARDLATAGDADLAATYGRTALSHLVDLHRDLGEPGVRAMLDKLECDGLERLIVAAVDEIDSRQPDENSTE